MGSVIVQLAPDDKRYVVWSSVSGGPTLLLSGRKALRRHLFDDYSPNRIRECGGRKAFRKAEIDPIVERITETGTSGRSHLGSQFRFSARDDDLIVFGDFTFHRRHLPQVADALFSDEVLSADDEHEASIEAMKALAAVGTVNYDPCED